MSEYKWCPTCGKYAPISTHKCPPGWSVFLEDEEADYWQSEEFVIPRPVYAMGADEAAEKWVRQFDLDTAGGYEICQGNPLRVVVWDAKALQRKVDLLADQEEANIEGASDSFAVQEMQAEIAELEKSSRFLYEVSGEYVPSYSAELVQAEHEVS